MSNMAKDFVNKDEAKALLKEVDKDSDGFVTLPDPHAMETVDREVERDPTAHRASTAPACAAARSEAALGLQPDLSATLRDLNNRALPNTYRTSEIAQLEKTAEHSITDIIAPSALLHARARKAEAAASADVRMENRREVLQITLQNVQGMPTPLNEHGKLMTLTDLKTHGAKQAVRVCLLYKPDVSAKDEFIGNAYRTLAVQPEKSRFQDFWTFENDADGEFGDNQILIQAEPPKESEDASRDAPAELSDDEEGEDGKKPAKSKSVPKSMKNKKFQSIGRSSSR